MSSPSRRDLLRGVGIAGVSLAAGAGLSQAITSRRGDHVGASRVSFRGVHQSGITTPAPDYLSLIAFDLDVESATDIRDLLNAWSAVVADLVAGRPVGPEQSPSLSPRDTGEALELGASSLTVTIGYGPSLFERPDTSHLPRPRHLAPLPTFVGDNLDNRLGGGDVVFQICSQDAQVNFHAVHSLERLAQGLAHLRYWHRGFGRTSAVGGKQESTRNLLGFKDGTNNLQSHHVDALADVVWVRDGREPSWLQHGTYLIHRKIRTFIETWSAQSLDTQEATIGRFRASGAPLTGKHEHDPPDLNAVDQYGNYVIPTSAHIRSAAPSSNHGMRILRRGFSYADGIDSHSGQFDAGLHFICFQQNPLAQFAAIQQTLSQNDALMNYLTHLSSTVAACPRGLAAHEGWGDQLFA